MAFRSDISDERAQQDALEALLSGKTELAETRLAVTAVQIIERLRIRAKNLGELMDEELAAGNKLLQIQGRFPYRLNLEIMGLESEMERRVSQVQSMQRREDVECWRDLTQVMRDFLNAWEAFSRNAAKNRFLAVLPASQPPQWTHPGYTRASSIDQPDACSTPHNDNQTKPRQTPE